MRIINWIKNFWKKEDTIENIIDEQSVAIEDVDFICPKCDSKNIGFYTGLSNFIQMRKGEQPLYTQSFRCLNCGYSVKSKPGDESDKFLFENLKWEPKEIKVVKKIQDS